MVFGIIRVGSRFSRLSRLIGSCHSCGTCMTQLNAAVTTVCGRVSLSHKLNIVLLDHLHIV